MKLHGTKSRSFTCCLNGQTVGVTGTSPRRSALGAGRGAAVARHEELPAVIWYFGTDERR